MLQLLTATLDLFTTNQSHVRISLILHFLDSKLTRSLQDFVSEHCPPWPIGEGHEYNVKFSFEMRNIWNSECFSEILLHIEEVSTSIALVRRGIALKT